MPVRGGVHLAVWHLGIAIRLIGVQQDLCALWRPDRALGVIQTVVLHSTLKAVPGRATRRYQAAMQHAACWRQPPVTPRDARPRAQCPPSPPRAPSVLC